MLNSKTEYTRCMIPELQVQGWRQTSTENHENPGKNQNTVDIIVEKRKLLQQQDDLEGPRNKKRKRNENTRTPVRDKRTQSNQNKFPQQKRKLQNNPEIYKSKLKMDRSQPECKKRRKVKYSEIHPESSNKPDMPAHSNQLVSADVTGLENTQAQAEICSSSELGRPGGREPSVSTNDLKPQSKTTWGMGGLIPITKITTVQRGKRIKGGRSKDLVESKQNSLTQFFSLKNRAGFGDNSKTEYLNSNATISPISISLESTRPIMGNNGIDCNVTLGKSDVKFEDNFKAQVNPTEGESSWKAKTIQAQDISVDYAEPRK